MLHAPESKNASSLSKVTSPRSVLSSIDIIDQSNIPERPLSFINPTCTRKPRRAP